MLRRVKFWVVIAALLCTFTVCGAAEHPAQFPPPVDSYRDAQLSLGAKLRQRAAAEPLNLVATIIFGLAIIHTFLAPKIMHVAHRWRHEHREKLHREGTMATRHKDAVEDVSFKAEAAHFFGEIEAIFGLWVVPLLFAFLIFKDWGTAEHYVSNTVHFTEPMFVVVIMAIAATRPILLAAESAMRSLARLGGGS